MSNGSQGPWRGHGPNLEAAFVDAWNNAKNAGAGPGTYKVEILIEANNPIHSYIVILSPTP